MSDNYLPFDIQEEIMKKLPLASLIRFRSVSKAWKSLITFKFLAKLDNVCEPRRQFISYQQDYNVKTHHHYHTFDDETFPQYNFTPNPTIGKKSASALPELIPQRECPFPLINSNLVDSSHGLLCFYNTATNKFFIWNPSIGKSIAIVVPSRPTAPYYIVEGFGVCPITLDPKIIMIPHCSGKDIIYRISRAEVKVFSLSSCAWAPSINLPRETVRLEQNSQEVIDRFIYWLASDDLKIECDIVSKLIVSFDLTSEELREIHLPESIKLGTLSISKLRETLVVLEYNTVTFCEIKSHAVWMMDDDLFIRLYSITIPATSLYTILGFRNNGATIFERHDNDDEDDDYDDKLVVTTYEPDSKQITQIGVFDSECSFSVHSYMETLLLIDQPDGTIYEHCKEKTLRKRKASDMIC